MYGYLTCNLERFSVSSRFHHVLRRCTAVSGTLLLFSFLLASTAHGDTAD